MSHFFARVFGLIVVPVVVYISFFFVHFHLLSNSGPGDHFMTPEFQKTLNNSLLHTPRQRTRVFRGCL